LPWWDRSNNTLILNEHINATGKLGNKERYEIDFIPDPPAVVDRKGKIVSPEHAQALYYNNLGAEAIVRMQYEEAKNQFRVALSIEPENADIWNNMGIVRHRLGRMSWLNPVCVKP
jgi:Flp pilus assembly protein TadD